MENTNRYRNQSYQEDWNENDQGYSPHRSNQNRYQRSSDNENWRNQNYGNQGWQNSDRGGYDQYMNRGSANRGNYSDEQNRQDFDRGNYQNREEDYRRNTWNQGYENRNYNQNYGQGNPASDRGNRDTGDRNWWDRTSDEVASWFGDDDAERRRRMDKINGPHRGKGPKGYTRSDGRITEDVNEKLYQDPFVDASNIEITVLEGQVTLSGTVESREAKRRAEDLAEDVPGVKDVTNQIKVNANSVYETSNNREGEQYNGRKKSSWLS